MDRPTEDLERAGLTIGFELTEFAGDFAKQNRDTAYFEACLLHARNLIEFLIGRKRPRWPSDLAPEQFVPDWVPLPEDAVARLREHLDELDKHLAHLTWQRIDWAKDETLPAWDYPQLAEDVFAAFQRFAQQAQAHGAPQLVVNLDIAKRRVDG